MEIPKDESLFDKSKKNEVEQEIGQRISIFDVGKANVTNNQEDEWHTRGSDHPWKGSSKGARKGAGRIMAAMSG